VAEAADLARVAHGDAAPLDERVARAGEAVVNGTEVVEEHRAAAAVSLRDQQVGVAARRDVVVEEGDGAIGRVGLEDDASVDREWRAAARSRRLDVGRSRGARRAEPDVHAEPQRLARERPVE
jgi:hypothetical protein